MEQRYANILFDDTFKVVVCAPGNEALLIKIVELLVPGKLINKLEFRDKENHGLSVSDKITTFDLFCTGDSGEQFVVEMQFSPQAHYADRMLCYATYPIRAQLSEKLSLRKERVLRGEQADKMDYGLMPLYVISLLNFSIQHDGPQALENGLICRYSIRNDNSGELMTEALRFIYLELGRLNIPKEHPEKCRTLLEKFAFSLKYMHQLEGRPESFEEEVLQLLYDAAEFANMSVEQQTTYESFMRTEIDIIAEKTYARESGFAEGRAEGIAEGRAEGLAEVARNFLTMGFSIDQVSEGTGLSIEEVSNLQSSLDSHT